MHILTDLTNNALPTSRNEPQTSYFLITGRGLNKLICGAAIFYSFTLKIKINSKIRGHLNNASGTKRLDYIIDRLSEIEKNTMSNAT